MTAINCHLLIFCLIFPISYGCIPTVDPDSDEWDMMELTTTVIETTTTTTASICPPGWIVYPDNNYCYIASGDMAYGNLEQAEMACAALYPGAHLASIHSQAENDFVYNNVIIPNTSNPNPGTWWIGLSQPANTDTLSVTSTWTDETKYDYTAYNNFALAPPPVQGSDRCVFMHVMDPPRSGKWGDAACDQIYSYVCKVPGTGITPPSPPCPDDWSLYNGFCYHASGDSAYGNYDQGEMACADLYPGAHLVSIHSTAENNYVYNAVILSNTNNPNPGTWWIGLSQPANTMTLSETSTWTDGSLYDYTAFQNFAATPPAMQGTDRCIFMHVMDPPRSGQWGDAACDQIYSYVCKVPEIGTTPPPPPCPTPDWSLYNGFCYYASGDSAYGQWPQLDAACDGVYSGAHLVSIHSPAENDFVYNAVIIPHTSNPNPGTWYIGLYQPANTNDLSGTSTWTDGTTYDFTMYENFAATPPGMQGTDRCIFMHVMDPPRSGQWGDAACDQIYSYVCKVAAM